MKRAIPIMLLLTACMRRTPPTPSHTVTTAPSTSSPWVAARAPENAGFLELPALVQGGADSVAVLSPPYAGRIVRIHVRPGDRVTKGQNLVEVVMPEVVAAAGGFSAAQIRIAAIGARKKPLESLRAEGLARLAELTEVELALADAKAEEQRTRAILRAAGVDLASVPRLLEAGVPVAVRSPLSGIITEATATLGETREPTGPPLLRIAAQGTSRIEARIAHALPPGAQFQLLLPGIAPIPVEKLGESPARDPRDGTALAWFAGPAATHLPVGATGRLRVSLVRTSEGAVLVLIPATAVGLQDGKAFVQKRGAGADSAAVTVDVLMLSGSEALVRGALKPGDDVATQPLSR